MIYPVKVEYWEWLCTACGTPYKSDKKPTEFECCKCFYLSPATMERLDAEQEYEDNITKIRIQKNPVEYQAEKHSHLFDVQEKLDLSMALKEN